jgi:hypothetical protein
MDVVGAFGAGAGLDKAPGAIEDLERAGHVEALDARVDEDHDIARLERWRHGAIMAQDKLVRKDRFPTFSAIADSLGAHSR